MSGWAWLALTWPPASLALGLLLAHHTHRYRDSRRRWMEAAYADRHCALEQQQRAERAEAAIERVRKAVAERRTEVAEFEAENEPSAWSDAVSVTCGRIDDALREPAKPQGIRAALDEQPQPEPGVHTGGIAEDCPACDTSQTPHPFLCPGPKDA